jgi:hypothetical protein
VITINPKGAWKIYAPTVPAGATPCGTVTRGQGDTGALVRFDATGLYAQCNGGAVRSLDQRAVRSALGAEHRPTAPSTDAVRAYLKARGITGAEAARRGYLSGGQAVRKYTGGARPHQVSNAVWFAWHAHELLDAETVARIEAAMEVDACLG